MKTIAFDSLGLIAEVTVITPGLAEAWLKCKNPNNRRLSVKNVEMMADDMRSGRWRVTGEAITFDKNGMLTNGHHRLNACISAGVPFTSMVIWGLDVDAVLSQDTGASRTAGHIASLRGIACANHVSSASRLLLCYETGDPLRAIRGKGPTKAAVLEDCLSRPNFEEAKSAGARVKHLMYKSVATACYWLFSRRDAAMAEMFFDKLASGVGLVPGDPVLRLRERMIWHAKNKAKMRTEEMMALTIKAWNAFRKGKTLSVLRWRHSDRPDEVFPTVE